MARRRGLAKRRLGDDAHGVRLFALVPRIPNPLDPASRAEAYRRAGEQFGDALNEYFGGDVYLAFDVMRQLQKDYPKRAGEERRYPVEAVRRVARELKNKEKNNAR